MSDFNISWTSRNSRLSKLISRFIETNLLKFIPSNVSSFSLVLLSNFFVWMVVLLTVMTETWHNIAVAAIPVLLLLHLIGGHTSQFVFPKENDDARLRLTAFLDHYLITLNSGILIYVIVNSLEVRNTLLIALLLVATYLSSVAVYYKQFKTGELRFPVFGYSEGVVVAALLISLSNISSFKIIITSVQLLGFPLLEILLLIIITIVLVSFIKIIKGIPNMRYSIWMFAILFSITGAISAQLYSQEGVILLLTLYACLYISKILTGYFIDGIERSPGLFTPSFLIIIFFFPGLFELNTLLVIIIYLAANNILQVYRFIKVIKKLA